MLYELANPSDTIVFEASNPQVACLCAWSLSQMYWVKDQDGKSYGMPAFHWEWVIEDVMWLWWKDSIEKFLKDNDEEMKKCYRSFFYGDFGDYEQYQKALALITEEDKRLEFIKHNEDRRSSMSRIVKVALSHWGIELWKS